MEILPLEWAPLWRAMKENPTAWIRTTEKMSDEMLNTLPPRAFGPSCFLVGEPDHDDEHGRPTYACFRRRRVEGRTIHEARYLAVEQFPDEALRVESPRMPEFPKGRALCADPARGVRLRAGSRADGRGTARQRSESRAHPRT